MIDREDFNKAIGDFQILKGIEYPGPQMAAVYKLLCRDGLDAVTLRHALDHVARNQEIRYKDIYGAIHAALKAMRDEERAHPRYEDRIKASIDIEGCKLAKMYVDFIGWMMKKYQGTRYLEIFNWFTDNYWTPFCDDTHEVLAGKIREAWKVLSVAKT